jgi:hypothetical protein
MARRAVIPANQQRTYFLALNAAEAATQDQYFGFVVHLLMLAYNCWSLWTGHDRDDRARCSDSRARRERTSAIPKHPPPRRMMFFRPSESLSIFNVICDF